MLRLNEPIPVLNYSVFSNISFVPGRNSTHFIERKNLISAVVLENISMCDIIDCFTCTGSCFQIMPLNNVCMVSLVNVSRVGHPMLFMLRLLDCLVFSAAVVC